MGAYRQLRKNTLVMGDNSRVLSPSVLDLNQTPDAYIFDQSSMVDGASPEKGSYMQKLRKKSAERSRSGAGEAQLKKGGTIA
jgi:hypothetical protein